MQAAHVPDEYFTRVVEELEARATEYKAEIDEVAEFLKAQGIVLSSGASGFGNGMSASLLDNLSQRYMDIGLSASDMGNIPRGRTIEDIIRRQYDYFMVVASHIANVNENLRAVKEQYLQVLRERDSDVLNPFQQADMREKVEKDRQRLLAEKRAAVGALSFVNSVNALPQSSAATGSAFGNLGTIGIGSSSAAGTLTTQPSLFQSSGTTGSLFGGAPTAAGAASSGGGLFGGGGFGFGGSSAAAGSDSEAKRATRRKRD
ncbi:hypothetical protein BWQ96_08883 [Gracilariopsis chorda]|uniref:Nucleoporin p58/p45 n=1 Tax=Gracilariopsis chorda TaxID=448386 RepID=A0A2V3IH16_9FLOR|nr:hypothetical protein BWQ96_08883 [Gracilariopsis chorda]|eukprot:PXF41385.1 hypothetical protein BWQ96_08883 [Gracilariopsis chorda]